MKINNAKNVILLRLTEFYKKNPNPSISDIFRAITENWCVSLKRAKNVDYILVLDNKDNLVGIYKLINAIDTKIKGGNTTRKELSIDTISSLEFIQDFIGENLKNIFVKGNQNPVNYGKLEGLLKVKES